LNLYETTANSRDRRPEFKTAAFQDGSVHVSALALERAKLKK
jgi:hypothetical protein